jgi:hypothetical protein
MHPTNFVKVDSSDLPAPDRSSTVLIKQASSAFLVSSGSFGATSYISGEKLDSTTEATVFKSPLGGTSAGVG